MFKVGDKVKVVYNSNESGIVADAMNKIGVVESISYISGHVGMVVVKFDEQVCGMYVVSFYTDEIEKVSIKGQQLVFDFMK